MSYLKIDASEGVNLGKPHTIHFPQTISLD
jgi:hypothetical protein